MKKKKIKKRNEKKRINFLENSMQNCYERWKKKRFLNGKSKTISCANGRKESVGVTVIPHFPSFIQSTRTKTEHSNRLFTIFSTDLIDFVVDFQH